MLNVLSSATAGTIAPFSASVSLVGPFLQVTNSALTITADLIGVFNGATVASITPAAFIELDNTSLTLGVPGVITGNVLQVAGTGGVTPGTSQASVDLKGPLLETQGATVDVTGSIVKQVDAQLLAATLPALVNLIGGQLTTGSHAIDLSQNAKLDVSLGDLIRLTNSAVMTVKGNLVNVNGSTLNVAGSLVSLGNGNILNVNGVLLNLLNGGIANIGGFLVNFVGSNNTINLTNSPAPTNSINGIPIFIAAGATLNFTISPTPLNGLNGNAINFNASTGTPGSLIAVGTGGGTLKIGPSADATTGTITR
jgi:hypothetical protein